MDKSKVPRFFMAYGVVMSLYSTERTAKNRNEAA